MRMPGAPNITLIPATKYLPTAIIEFGAIRGKEDSAGRLYDTV